MNSQERLLTAWSHREPDRVPIELQIYAAAYEYPEAERVVDFVENEADNFLGVPGADFGFAGLPSGYTEEVIEDVPGDYRRVRRTHATTVGEFTAVTRHNYDEIIASDFKWERRYIDTLEEMERLAGARRSPAPLRVQEHRSAVAKIGTRGIPLVGLWHPLGWLVRNANMEEVYIWLETHPGIMHRYLEATATEVADTVGLMGESGIGPYFTVTAHEMLIPPWMGHAKFDEFIVPYDKRVNDEIHRIGGRLRAHCHGNCMDYLTTMREMGVDAIEPLEPPPFGDVDLSRAKEEVGGDMLLSGNVTSNAFPQMSREEVREQVRAVIRTGGPGGGFTLRTTGGNAATNSVKTREQMIKVLDNIEAYVEAALEFGQYPIRV